MTNFWATHKIYPSITTTRRADWHQMIKDVTALNLTEVCLFPTCLDYTAMQELYKLLEDSTIKSIPFVHLRGEDMSKEEIEYLIRTFKTKVFNIHTSALPVLKTGLVDYIKQIYIENHPFIDLSEETIKQVAGVCIDFSHLEESKRMFPTVYKANLSMIKQFPSGCAHLSAVRDQMYHDDDLKRDLYSNHLLEKLSDMDYLKNYPAEFFPPILAIELENPLAQQLEIIDYIKKML